MKRFEPADISCLAVTLFWGTNMALVKHVLHEFHPMSFNGLRMILAASLLGAYLLLRERRVVLHRGDLKKILALGIIGNTGYQLLFIHGLYVTKAGNAALLISISTIFTALLSRALGHEKFSRLLWAGIFLSFLGVSLILFESLEFSVGAGALRGDFLILGASACWSAYTVFAKPLMGRYSPLGLSTLTIGVGSIVLFLAALPSLADQSWDKVSFSSYLILTYSVIFPIALGYILWFHGVAQLGSTRTAVYGNLVPFFGLTFAGIFLGETITAMQIGAGCLILTGIYLTKLGRPLIAPAVAGQRQY